MYNSHQVAPTSNVAHHPISLQNMTPVTTSKLLKQGRIAAERFDECDLALAELNDGFGKTYDASRNQLTSMLETADSAGIDLSQFKGDQSLFKFPDLRTNIVVRIDKLPTAHKSLEAVDKKIEKLELSLKLAKEERKHLVTKLSLKGSIDLVTAKVITSFRRIK